MEFEIRSRSGVPKFIANIDCPDDASDAVKIGLAVKWACKTGADLTGADLAGANLVRADLTYANLSGVDLAGADLTGANLTYARLGGADLAQTNLCCANFTDANIELADFAEADLKEATFVGADVSCTNFVGADLVGANFAGADLARAYLSGANLSGAILAGANLTAAYVVGACFDGADLSEARLDGTDLTRVVKVADDEIPVVPNIDAAILAAIEGGGILRMSSWHGPNDNWCGTVHCRAGWAIHLAGEKGRDLEDKVGPYMAAVLIYRASRPGVPAPWFFDSSDGALSDIKRCAKAMEAA